MKQFALALATLLAAACSSNVSHATVAASNIGNTLGSTAPAFDADAVIGNAVLHLSDFRGKVVVLNFWATWCPPCRIETPDLIRAYELLRAPDVVFVGLDTTESPDIVKSFVALKDIPYQVGIAKTAVYNDYGISYIPTTIVLDANGIVRARWIGPITPRQLKVDIAHARAGKNSTFSTPQQAKIDRELAPAQFHFEGSRTAEEAEIKRAQARLAAVTTEVVNLPANTCDYERTNHETGALELKVASAATSLARTKSERVAADRLLIAADSALNRYADAVAADKAALALEPRDPNLVESLTGAFYRMHDYPNMLAQATAWTKLSPNDSDAWDQLGLANQRSGHYDLALPAYKRTLAIMIADAKRLPIGKDGEAVADVADESLDVANVYVSLGDAKNAQLIFNQATAYAKRIPPGSIYATLRRRVAERTIEGMTAVSMAHTNRTTLALGVWTGANLPGSLSTGIRYRLIAVAPPDRVVTIRTKGLRAGWIASFCQDRLCSPNTVTFTMPATGLKSYEFLLVPPVPNAKPGIVSVGGDGTNWITTQLVR